MSIDTSGLREAWENKGLGLISKCSVPSSDSETYMNEENILGRFKTVKANGRESEALNHHSLGPPGKKIFDRKTAKDAVYGNVISL